MIFDNLVKRAGKLLADNSPLVLTAIGVTGTVTTAFLAAKASFAAAEKIEDEKNSRLIRKTDADGHLLPAFDNRAKAELVWKCYIPAAGTLVMTVACIVTANRIGTRRAAALASAYALSEKAWGEYKDQIIKTIGANKEQKVVDTVAQDRVTNNPPVDRQIIITEDGNVLCHDSLTGRYFMGTIEKIKAAQNEINHDVNTVGYASLSDFYYLIGLSRTSMSEEFGWNGDQLMEINFTTTLAEDGKRPCISFSFNHTPIRDFHLFHGHS
jgi:Family of unknown function (DUF6353)